MRIVVVCVVRRRGVRGRIIRDGSCCGRLGRRRNGSLFRPILLLIPPVFDNCLDGWMDGTDEIGKVWDWNMLVSSVCYQW